MEIKLYNSLTNKLEVFKPLVEGEVSLYVCGPTVYDYVHVGNMRPVVVFDTLTNFFSYLGYRVKHVSNYTDVDDRIIQKAIAGGVSEKAIAENTFLHMKKILMYKCEKADIKPTVTEFMPK